MLYNRRVDPVILCSKCEAFLLAKTEPERGGLPTVLSNPRDCILAGSTRPSLSGFYI